MKTITQRRKNRRIIRGIARPRPAKSLRLEIKLLDFGECYDVSCPSKHIDGHVSYDREFNQWHLNLFNSRDRAHFDMCIVGSAPVKERRMSSHGRIGLPVPGALLDWNEVINIFADL